MTPTPNKTVENTLAVRYWLTTKGYAALEVDATSDTSDNPKEDER